MDQGHSVIQARIVYWGPAGSGKTASLMGLRACLDPDGRFRLYSVEGEDGSTLFFDMLPVEEFRFGSARVRLRLIAAPGESECLPTRLELLEKADAIVFVADSSADAMEANRESLRELRAALQAEGRDPDAVPTVWSFNRRDEPDAVPAGEMAGLLEAGDVAVHETVASEGSGLLESFAAVFRLLLADLAKRHEIEGADLDEATPTRLLPQVARGGPSRGLPPPSDDRHVVIRVPAGADEGFEQAIEAQVRMAEAHAETDTTTRMLQGRNRELMAINRVARSILSAMEVDNLLVVLLDATAGYLESTHASCVVFDSGRSGSLHTHVLGFGRDPVLGLPQAMARTFFDHVQQYDGPVPAQPHRNPELLEGIQQVDRRVSEALFQPIKGNNGRSAGWIGIYATHGETLPGTQGLLFLSSIARIAALGLEKIAHLNHLQQSVARLEQDVQDRTGKLEMAQARVRALNRGLESRVGEATRALTDANRALKEETARAAHRARLAGMGHVAASFAHEVNNPLSGLSGNLQYMRESLDDLKERVAVSAGEAADGLAAIQEFEAVIDECAQSAARITALIASLKRFGGEDKLGSRIQLNAAVADAVTLLEERIEASAELELRLGTLPEITGDVLELSHVVLSLLTNAVEAVERRGEKSSIKITTFATGDRVSLVVKDAGPGMDEETLKKALEPFVSTKEGEPGSGLGLHCAYQTLQRHGGSIRVRSQPGEGTTVNVEIPVESGAMETPEPTREQVR